MKIDRRVLRSQQALKEALLQLMLEKGYGETTVSDIVERANVGRSTFYVHFADKEDLLQQSLQGLRDFLTDETLVPSQREGPSHPALAFALPMFLHAYEQQRLFRSLMAARSGAPVQEHLQIMLTDLVIERLERGGCLDERSGEEQLLLRAQCIVGAFLALLMAWVASPDDVAPHEIDRKFREMMISGPLGARL
jgi:AcrR family transcriptional regulator